MDDPSDRMPQGLHAADEDVPELTPEARDALERLRASEGPTKLDDEPHGSEDDLLESVPVELQRALKRVRKHGKKITERLNADPELAAHFAADPIAALKKIGVEVPPELARLGRPKVGLDQALEPLKLKLPGGQTAAPRVRIRFTDGKR